MSGGTRLGAVHKELAFEDEVCEYLVGTGWSIRTHLKDATTFNRESAIYPDDLLAFVQSTQPKEWAKFKKWHNGDADALFCKRVADQLDSHGTLHVLRHGFKDVSSRFFVFQGRPATDKNPDLAVWYAANRLTAIRQLHYSVSNENCFDLVLFLNGLPVATVELKTDLTQNVADAIRQYRTDRLPKDPKTNKAEPLLTFKRGALVHFAVSSDEVHMTTHLEGARTGFLPFNQGTPDGLGGAGKGNAPNKTGYATDYLWKEVWQRDVWLDILSNFLHLEKKETEKAGKKVVTESLIFPRYHQLDAVRKLLTAVPAEGSGFTYLIQHSAGSGKSNTIAWTAHRLSSLHNSKGEKIFDTVIVITDRRVLDQQLQDTIYQFEHKQGVVQKIDEDSQQLADALKDGRPIIITTLQKFPFVIDKVGGLDKRKFALLIDEAHSSQSGNAAQTLRQVLGADLKSLEATDPKAEGEDEEPELSSEDVLNAVMASRLRPKNVSYFAFTATPKNKTLELFGRPDSDGRPVPFHVYSMRQAIEEGFILDVLQNYTTYTAYYRLQQTGDDPEVKVDKASKALARFLRLHPYNIAQKVEVIVEHFRAFVMSKIDGRAKAMIVTDSRKAAVRYKVAFDKYLVDHGYTDCRALVAFSGKVSDPETGPTEFSETNMNTLKGVGIPEAFNTDEYRLLLVANKFQTGFDQPLLHTMYVDKRLSGVLAVQTLSRLNRTCRGKEDTFVLDFVNDADEILDSFKPYFRTATLMGVTDPNLVHELQIKLDAAQVYHTSEVEGFAKAFFDPKRKQGSLHSFLKPAADRFASLDAEKQDGFRKDLGTFLRMYEFLSQIVPYEDPELEQRYSFGRHLMPRLVNLRQDSPFDLDDEVKLTHYRLQKLSTRALQLQVAEPTSLYPVAEAGTGQSKDPESKRLSEIIGKMNDLFAGDLSDADKVAYATHIRGKLLENDKLAEQAQGNTLEQFKLGDFDRVFSDVVIDGLDKYQGMASQVLNNERIRDELKAAMVKWVYDGLVAGTRPPALE